MMSEVDLLHKRINAIERDIRGKTGAPTFPIYDPLNLPQDTLDGQIVIGTDGSLNWKVEGIWYTKIGTLSTVDSVPQDAINGQIAIGSDNSLNWFYNGVWNNGVGLALVGGGAPQDAVQGQLAITKEFIGGSSSGVGLPVGSGSGGIGTVTDVITVGSNVLAVWGMYSEDSDGGATAVAAFDSQGNTWSVGNPFGIGPLNEAIGSFPSFNNVGVGAAYGSITNPLSPGDTVTVTIVPDIGGSTILETIVMLYVLDPQYSKMPFFAQGMGSPSSSPDTALIFQSGDGAYFPAPADFGGNPLGAIFTTAVGFGGGGWAPTQGTFIDGVDGSNISIYASIITDVANGAVFEPGGLISTFPCCAEYTLFVKDNEIGGGGGGNLPQPSPIWFKDGNWYGFA